ncbi:MAG: hypothetical protein FWC79_00010 [Oscillospiraceae bacterium]|nr:hypothetical protein [Oscillospiraceae bacterium]
MKTSTCLWLLLAGFVLFVAGAIVQAFIPNWPQWTFTLANISMIAGGALMLPAIWKGSVWLAEQRQK